MSKEVIKILTIDGGGVRGLIPAIVLETLSKEINNKPFYKCFDLISGTSTGALITLLLSIPNANISTILKNNTIPKNNNDFDAKNKDLMKLIIDLYEHESNKIFNNNFGLYKKIRQLYSSKYKNTYFNKLLKNYFGNAKLSDALTNILIPVLDMSTMDAFFFKHRPKYYKYKNDYDFYVKDIALSASAAPTYFPAMSVKSINHDRSFCFVDGGLFANNPSLCAYIEAKKIFPDAKKYVVISLGTGQIKRSYKCDKVKHWGVFGWVNPFNNVPLLTSFMHAQDRSCHHMIKNLPDVDIYRLNPNITGCNIEIDSTNSISIKKIKDLSYKYLNKNDSIIKKISKILNDVM